jgi:histone deacetylase complex subunit SAP30
VAERNHALLTYLPVPFATAWSQLNFDEDDKQEQLLAFSIRSSKLLVWDHNDFRKMPPARSRPQHDDSRSESSSTKEKAGSHSTTTVNGKNRRGGNNTQASSSLRDVVTADSSAAGGVNGNAEGAQGVSTPLFYSKACYSTDITQIQWSSFDADILHGYRHDYRLNTPAAYNNNYNQIVLNRSPIGKMSPTMIGRRKEERKQSKDQLANAVRKHFNSMGIVENEVVVDFLYKVRWQGEESRAVLIEKYFVDRLCRQELSNALCAAATTTMNKLYSGTWQAYLALRHIVRRYWDFFHVDIPSAFIRISRRHSAAFHSLRFIVTSTCLNEYRPRGAIAKVANYDTGIGS